MSDLLTLKEAAARLRITPKHAKGLIRDGKLKWINVGRGEIKPRIRVSSHDIDEYEQNNKHGALPCQYSSGRGRRSIRSTAGLKVVGLEEQRRLLTERKRKK